MNPPCFDPTCGCCEAWSGLNDHLQAQLDSVVPLDEKRRWYALQIASTKMANGASAGTAISTAKKLEAYLKGTV